MVRLGVVALAALPLSTQAQWTSQVEGGVVHDSNFSRAQRAEDRISDTALTLGAAAERALPTGADLSLAAGARVARYVHSEGASYAAADLTSAWRGKLGLGLTAPWFTVRGSAGVENAREAVRDALRYAFSTAGGRRFNERLEASAGFAYDRRVQREDLAVVPGYGGKPFSLQGRTLFARASYALGNELAVLGSASLRKGDIESSTRRNFTIFTASNAIAWIPRSGRISSPTACRAPAA